MTIRNSWIAPALLMTCLGGCNAPDTETDAPALGQAAEAMSTLRAGGEYFFVFDESAQVKARVTADCERDHAGRRADVEACVDRIRQVGATEGFRIVREPGDKLRWVSFGLENGEEAIYKQMGFEIADVRSNVVHARPTEKAPFEAVTFEVVDGKTIAMQDSRKGRLVFRKRL
jgi:hypothetical protein